MRPGFVRPISAELINWCADEIQMRKVFQPGQHCKFFWINVVSFLVPSFCDGMSGACLHLSSIADFNAVFVRAALSVALALPLVPTGTAQAELFWSHYRSGGWDDYGPFRSHHYRSWGWDDHETKFRSKQIVPRIVICEPHNQLSPFVVTSDSCAFIRNPTTTFLVARLTLILIPTRNIP